MQEFRRHRYNCPRAHPEGVYRLDVFFDYGAFPVWGPFTVPARGDRPERLVHGALNARYLGLTSELGEALRAWSDWRDRHSEWGGGQSATDQERERQHELGKELAGRLAEETGAEVLYQWPHGEDRDRDCPHCGRTP